MATKEELARTEEALTKMKSEQEESELRRVALAHEKKRLDGEFERARTTARLELKRVTTARHAAEDECGKARSNLEAETQTLSRVRREREELRRDALVSHNDLERTSQDLATERRKTETLSLDVANRDRWLREAKADKATLKTGLARAEVIVTTARANEKDALVKSDETLQRLRLEALWNPIRESIGDVAAQALARQPGVGSIVVQDAHAKLEAHGKGIERELATAIAAQKGFVRVCKLASALTTNQMLKQANLSLVSERNSAVTARIALENKVTETGSRVSELEITLATVKTAKGVAEDALSSALSAQDESRTANCQLVEDKRSLECRAEKMESVVEEDRKQRATARTAKDVVERELASARSTIDEYEKGRTRAETRVAQLAAEWVDAKKKLEDKLAAVNQDKERLDRKVTRLEKAKKSLETKVGPLEEEATVAIHQRQTTNAESARIAKEVATERLASEAIVEARVAKLVADKRAIAEQTEASVEAKACERIAHALSPIAQELSTTKVQVGELRRDLSAAKLSIAAKDADMVEVCKTFASGISSDRQQHLTAQSNLESDLIAERNESAALRVELAQHTQLVATTTRDAERSFDQVVRERDQAISERDRAAADQATVVARTPEEERAKMLYDRVMAGKVPGHAAIPLGDYIDLLRQLPSPCRLAPLPPFNTRPIPDPESFDLGFRFSYTFPQRLSDVGVNQARREACEELPDGATADEYADRLLKLARLIDMGLGAHTMDDLDDILDKAGQILAWALAGVAKDRPERPSHRAIVSGGRDRRQKGTGQDENARRVGHAGRVNPVVPERTYKGERARVQAVHLVITML